MCYSCAAFLRVLQDAERLSGEVRELVLPPVQKVTLCTHAQRWLDESHAHTEIEDIDASISVSSAQLMVCREMMLRGMFPQSKALSADAGDALEGPSWDEAQNASVGGASNLSVAESRQHDTAEACDGTEQDNDGSVLAHVRSWRDIYLQVTS